MLKTSYSLLIFLLMSTSFIGEKVVKDIQNLSPPEGLRQGKDHALFFAVNDYQSDQLRDLENPIKNATDIANTLKEHYGYQTEVVKNPTYDDMVNKLYEYRDKFAKNANGQYPSSGQLLIFFTGHGEEANRNGYFLPADAEPERLFQTGFAYSIWRPFIDELPCKHIMVAIDACYSGLFDPAWYSKATGSMGKRPGELSESEQLITEHDKYTTRWFLTSGTDVKTPDQSRFVSKFLEGLRSWGGDDAILTSSELWTYIERARPRPHQDEFGKNEGGSSFLFVLNKSIPSTHSKLGDTKQMEQDLASWQKTKQAHSISAYQSYLEQFPSGEFRQTALFKIRRLEQEAADHREDVAWEIAQEKNTQSAYDHYLKEYPKGRYAPDAVSKRDAIPVDDRFKDILAIGQNDPMVFVKGGTFSMGCKKGRDEFCADDEILHTVTIDDFYISKYEVSQSEWLSIMGENPSDNENCDNCPVENVSWDDVQEYIKKLNKNTGLTYHLPTEAEWEFAARGGKKSKAYQYAGTSNEDELYQYANFCDKNCTDDGKVETQNDGYETTAPVGSYLPNELGLYDMSGNVMEWCSDWYASDYYKSSPQRNPKGPVSGSERVIRGGSCYDEPATQLVASRGSGTQSSRYLNIGFRISRASR